MEITKEEFIKKILDKTKGMKVKERIEISEYKKEKYFRLRDKRRYYK